MTRSRQVKSHNHTTFDIRPLGECPSCDNYHERSGLTRAELDEAIFRILAAPEGPYVSALRLIRIMDDVDHDRHEELVDMLVTGAQLAEAVDDAMGAWPDPASRDGAR